MHYYADDLADMMLDDILRETAIELQVIENKERQSHQINEGKALAENLLKHISDYQSEQDLVQMRWTSKAATSGPKLSKIDITEDQEDNSLYYQIEQRQPKGIKFEEDKFEEQSMPKYQNPFEVGSGAQQHLSLNTQNILE